jgi:hypothetical protein
MSNPFALNPFHKGKSYIPLKLSPAPQEIEKKKYYEECTACGSDVSRGTRIVCTECGKPYCGDHADIESGICNRCAKDAAGRAQRKIRSTERRLREGERLDLESIARDEPGLRRPADQFDGSLNGGSVSPKPKFRTIEDYRAEQADKAAKRKR